MAAAIDDYSAEPDGIPQLPEQRDEDQSDQQPLISNQHQQSHSPNSGIANGHHAHSPQSQQSRSKSPPSQNVAKYASPSASQSYSQQSYQQQMAHQSNQIRSPFSTSLSNRFHNFQQSFKSSLNEFTV